MAVHRHAELKIPKGQYVVKIVTKDHTGKVVREQESLVPNWVSADVPHQVLEALYFAYANGRVEGLEEARGHDDVVAEANRRAARDLPTGVALGVDGEPIDPHVVS